MLQAHERLSCKGDYVPLKGRINPCTPYRMCRPACGCSCRHTRRDPSCPSHTLRGPDRARTCSCVPLLQLLSLHNKIHAHSVFHLLTQVSAMEICFISTEIKTISDKNDYNPHALFLRPVCKTESFLVFYPWRQRRFGDVKMKRVGNEPTTW